MTVKKGRNSGGNGDDGDLWQTVTKSIRAYAPSPQQPSRPKKAERAPTPLPKMTPSAAKAAPEAKGFDRSTETKLKRGQLPLEGRLDLHGMTQAEAFGALHRFVTVAADQQKRTVLIITGKGERSEGVLKRMLPVWLEDPALKKHVLALSPAQPKDGGSGAFYLRLRKPR